MLSTHSRHGKFSSTLGSKELLSFCAFFHRNIILTACTHWTRHLCQLFFHFSRPMFQSPSPHTNTHTPTHTHTLSSHSRLVKCARCPCHREEADCVCVKKSMCVRGSLRLWDVFKALIESLSLMALNKWMWVRNGNRRNGGRQRLADEQGEGSADPMCIVALSIYVLHNTHDSCEAQRGWYHAHVLHLRHSVPRDIWPEIRSPRALCTVCYVFMCVCST